VCAHTPRRKHELCRGARGTDAIPYYNWAMSTLSISDYQLKPNPRPQGM